MFTLPVLAQEARNARPYQSSYYSLNIKADFHKKKLECKIYIIVQQKFGYRVILVGIFCQTRLILKNEISFKSVDHKNKILLIFTFQKTAIAIPFQGKFEIP